MTVGVHTKLESGPLHAALDAGVPTSRSGVSTDQRFIDWEDQTMATLRYIAYLANDPDKLVEFYRRFLGTEELGRSPEGDIPLPTVSII